MKIEDTFEEDRMAVEPAVPGDAEAIAHLLRSNADVSTLVLQSPSQIERHIDELFVVRAAGGEVIGCAQLRWHRPRIAEVSSVAVMPSRQRGGMGEALVRACVDRARARNAELVWLATAIPEWFERVGFVRISMWDVPLPVLLGRLPSVFRQPPRRWWGSIFGTHVFMRWAGGR